MEVREFDIVDDVRPAPWGGGARRLPTHLYSPSDGSPRPLIVFAHGFNGHPRKFTRLFRHWAAAGYAVAAPVFPVSNDLAPGGPTFADAAEQPADLHLVASHVSAEFGELVDPGHIGFGGLSLGGVTAYAASRRPGPVWPGAELLADPFFHSLTADLTAGLDPTAGPPALYLHADADPLASWEETAAVYSAAAPPKWLVTIHEEVHAEPFEDTPDPADRLVREVTTAFWDLCLLHCPGSEQRLQAAADDDLASLRWEDERGGG